MADEDDDDTFLASLKPAARPAAVAKPPVDDDDTFLASLAPARPTTSATARLPAAPAARAPLKLRANPDLAGLPLTMNSPQRAAAQPMMGTPDRVGSMIKDFGRGVAAGAAEGLIGDPGRSLARTVTAAGEGRMMDAAGEVAPLVAAANPLTRAGMGALALGSAAGRVLAPESTESAGHSFAAVVPSAAMMAHGIPGAAKMTNSAVAPLQDAASATGAGVAAAAGEFPRPIKMATAGAGAAASDWRTTELVRDSASGPFGGLNSGEAARSTPKSRISVNGPGWTAPSFTPPEPGAGGVLPLEELGGTRRARPGARFSEAPARVQPFTLPEPEAGGLDYRDAARPERAPLAVRDRVRTVDPLPVGAPAPPPRAVASTPAAAAAPLTQDAARRQITPVPPGSPKPTRSAPSAALPRLPNGELDMVALAEIARRGTPAPSAPARIEPLPIAPQQAPLELLPESNQPPMEPAWFTVPKRGETVFRDWDAASAPPPDGQRLYGFREGQPRFGQPQPQARRK